MRRRHKNTMSHLHARELWIQGSSRATSSRVLLFHPSILSLALVFTQVNRKPSDETVQIHFSGTKSEFCSVCLLSHSLTIRVTIEHWVKQPWSRQSSQAASCLQDLMISMSQSSAMWRTVWNWGQGQESRRPPYQLGS